MRIGIDIDGVLNDIHAFIIEYGIKFCDELGKYKLENINAQWSKEMFGWSTETAHELWDKYGDEFYMRASVREFASKVIEKLKLDNNEIYIITARCNGDDWFPIGIKDEAEEITVGWLKEKQIVYDKICFGSKDKVKVCKENDIDVMIEDDPKNIDSLMGSISTIIFDNPYNRLDKYNKVARASNWNDIYDMLRK